MKNVFIGISLVCITMSCNNKANTEKEIQAARQAAIDSVNQVVELERVKQATIDSMNLVKEEEARKAEKIAQTKSGSAYRYSSSGSSGNSGGYVPVSQSSSKKKMSNAAKGALIGAGVGALTGVAIAKDKKGKGALIGAGVGAGALTGVVVDKQQKKKQQQ